MRRTVLLLASTALAVGLLAGAYGDGKPMVAYASTALAPSIGAESSMDDIEVTVYYTPVESYYPREDLTYIKAWPDYSTTGTKVTLGPYPLRFVRHTKGEGTGQITSGKYAGKFLNWSYEGLGPNADQQGFWLDVCPRDAHGGCLKALETAAASQGLGLATGTRFELAECGTGATAEACSYFKSGNWVVNDQFTTGIASERQIDLYYGLQDRKEFRGSPYWTTMHAAVIRTF